MNNDHLLKHIEELAKILKPWRSSIVLGGGLALVLYDNLLSKSPVGVVGTTDVDFLIKRKPISPAEEKISRLLMDQGYELRHKSNGVPSIQSFVRQNGDYELEVEFLTDQKSRKKDNVVEIKAAGLNAQSLSYIEMSLEEAISITLSNQESILIVPPEAWVFHKGLTFPIRAQSAKKYKDLYGIWFVLTQLGDISLITREKLRELMKRNSASWSRDFYSHLRDWSQSATPGDWRRLMDQDPNGVLNQRGFENLVQGL
ncbi:MAG: hypothetical protein KF802_16170 [Bdellovibrionaceae bacterium]|nr:hypothetical protein [Pseudobdellovibrionaceae bacterium]